jgi:hypothetical protein
MYGYPYHSSLELVLILKRASIRSLLYCNLNAARGVRDEYYVASTNVSSEEMRYVLCYML